MKSKRPQSAQVMAVVGVAGWACRMLLDTVDDDLVNRVGAGKGNLDPVGEGGAGQSCHTLAVK